MAYVGMSLKVRRLRLPSLDLPWQGYRVHPSLPSPPHKPAREEGPPLLTCQLQRACLLLPERFDTKIVQKLSVLKNAPADLDSEYGGREKKD